MAKYAAKHDWIVLVNLPIRRERHFAAKVHAFNAALERVKHLEYEIIGNLDANVSLDEARRMGGIAIASGNRRKRQPLR